MSRERRIRFREKNLLQLRAMKQQPSHSREHKQAKRHRYARDYPITSSVGSTTLFSDKEATRKQFVFLAAKDAHGNAQITTTDTFLKKVQAAINEPRPAIRRILTDQANHLHNEKEALIGILSQRISIASEDYLRNTFDEFSLQNFQADFSNEISPHRPHNYDKPKT